MVGEAADLCETVGAIKAGVRYHEFCVRGKSRTEARSVNLIPLVHPNVALVHRMEESTFRQIWPITALLLKPKRQARREESREISVGTRNVHEK
jgi:hypothetical protein